jgi:hypothetical protein
MRYIRTFFEKSMTRIKWVFGKNKNKKQGNNNSMNPGIPMNVDFSLTSKGKVETNHFLFPEHARERKNNPETEPHFENGKTPPASRKVTTFRICNN